MVLLIAHPDATCDKIAAHLYNEGGEMYSNQTISKRLKELDITKKIASVEAYQAQTERVQRRVYAFWNHAPPLGICGIPRRMLIDVDEFGVTIERCNRKKGWALKVFRVRKDGHYGHGQKITVLFAIEPGDPTLPPHVYDSIQWPWQWIKCVRNIGTSTNTFRDFCEYVCSDIELNGIPGTDDQRIFIWDNLAAHHSAYVHATVTARAGLRRFYIVPRPPYHPKFGPIEYKICDITQQIKLKTDPDWDIAEVEQQIYSLAMTIGRHNDFDSTFIYCGYQW